MFRAGVEGANKPLDRLGEPEPVEANQGWIEHAEGTSEPPITAFGASWAVPAPPQRKEELLLGLGIGLQERGRSTAEGLLYVVLQWGRYEGKGGAQWGLACWYTPGHGQPLVQSTPVENIPSGHTVKASIVFEDGRWVCQAGTAGQQPTVLTVHHDLALHWAAALLEAHRLPGGPITAEDLPSSSETVFHGVGVKQSRLSRELDWKGEVDQAPPGRHVTTGRSEISLLY